MRAWMVPAGVNGAMAIAASAYAAHGLKGADPYVLSLMDKATTHQMAHALALGLVAVAGPRLGRWGTIAGALFTVGLLAFCGALYGIALGGLDLGGVAPFGGTSFILGWLALAVGGLRGSRVA